MTRPPYRLALTTSPAARALAATLAIAAAASALTACAPLVIGGAVGGALVATDRRTSGTQLEDKTIQLKAGNRIRDALGERGHTNANSYNRVVLLPTAPRWRPPWPASRTCAPSSTSWP
jgi:osmotically-inducible protein OsmY